jgi:hypothetical protein
MLRVTPAPEPLTPAAVGTKLKFAQPAAYRLLFYEMCRYGKREISGRSILVSGSRGAGKTTVVRLAIEMAARQTDLQAKPILIGLHGPDLFTPAPRTPPTSEADTAKKRSDKAADKNANSGESDPTVPPLLNPVADAALRMITKALYRVYMDELGRAYSKRVDDLFDPQAQATRESRQWRESAASLQVALDWAPNLTTLRQYWRRTKALDTGVFTRPAKLREGQGGRELVAAVTARDAFRLVSGKVKFTESDSENGSVSEDRKSGFDFKGLFNPLLGLLSGGLVGGTLLNSGAGPITTAVSAIAAAIATNLTLNFTTTRTIKRTRNRGQDFTWDTSLGSLDRMLPSLLERILDAGLAPIFVVDELDKIEGLEVKMVDLVKHLKHVVTERAFFCFLTNRDYFEYLEDRSRDGSYGPEHTFFTHRLFVTFEPTELREFVKDLLQIEAPQNADDAVDRLVLPYVLTHFARLHPIDLLRSISQITRADGSVSLAPGEVRQPGYRNAAFYQLVVEYLLLSPALNQRIHLEPEFQRLAYDALYYLAWNWAVDGKRELDLGIVEFAAYLTRRSDGKLKLPDTEEGLRGYRDVHILHGSMIQLAGFLSTPGKFREVLESEAAKQTEPAFRVDPPLVEIASSKKDKPLLQLKTGKLKDAATFVFDAYGELLEDMDEAPSARGAIAEPHKTPKELTLERIAQFEALNKFIKDECGESVDLGTIANDWGVIESTPSWTQVRAAINRKHSESTNTTQDAADEDTIARYHETLVRSSKSLKTTFLLAGFIARLVPMPVPVNERERFRKALTIVSEQLALPRRTPQQRPLKLAHTFQQLKPTKEDEEKIYAEMNDFIGKDLFPFDSEAFHKLMNKTWTVPVEPNFIDKRFRRWASEVSSGLAQPTWFYESELADLLAAAAQPASFRADVSSMSLTNWASLLSYIMKAGTQQDPEADCMKALAAFLRYLGFADSSLPGSANMLANQRPTGTFDRILMLLDPDASIAGEWKLDRGAPYAVLPVFFSDMTPFAQTLRAVGITTLRDLGISWIVFERVMNTNPQAFASFGGTVAKNDTWTSLPVFLLTDRPLGDTQLEIQATSLAAAIEAMRAIGPDGGIRNWGRLVMGMAGTGPIS